MQLCLKFYYTLQNVCNHYHYSKFENKNLNFSFSTELKTPITLATVYFSQNKISSKTPKFIYIFVLHLLPDGISLLVQKYEHRCMECWISQNTLSTHEINYLYPMYCCRDFIRKTILDKNVLTKNLQLFNYFFSLNVIFLAL